MQESYHERNVISNQNEGDQKVINQYKFVLMYSVISYGRLQVN